MKIYIVMDIDMPAKDSIVGIFSTLELANKAQENYELARSKVGSICIIVDGVLDE